MIFQKNALTEIGSFPLLVEIQETAYQALSTGWSGVRISPCKCVLTASQVYVGVSQMAPQALTHIYTPWVNTHQEISPGLFTDPRWTSTIWAFLSVFFASSLSRLDHQANCNNIVLTLEFM